MLMMTRTATVRTVLRQAGAWLDLVLAGLANDADLSESFRAVPAHAELAAATGREPRRPTHDAAVTPDRITRRSPTIPGMVAKVLLAEPRGFCAGVEMAIKALTWMVRIFRAARCTQLPRDRP